MSRHSSVVYTSRLQHVSLTSWNQQARLLSRTTAMPSSSTRPSPPPLPECSRSRSLSPDGSDDDVPPSRRPSSTKRRVVDLEPDKPEEDWVGNEDAALLEGMRTTSHRSRNRHLPAQPARKHSHRSRKGMYGVQTAKKAAKNRQLEGLYAELDMLNAQRELAAVELSKTYKMKVEEVRRRMMTSAIVKGSREKQIHNAKMSHIAELVNADLPRGEKLNSSQLNAHIANNRHLYDDYTEEEEAELLAKLEEKRTVKKSGARANNLLAKIVAKKTIAKIGQMMIALAQQTGVIGHAAFTRTHPHDKTGTYFVESEGGGDFLAHAFGKSAPDFMVMYEMWGMNRDKVTLANELLRLQKACRVIIMKGFLLVRGVTKAQMNHKDYIGAIVKKFGVGIIGWPQGVPFVTASKIGALPTIKKLHDALESGACHWRKLTPSEKARLIAQHEEMLENGEVTKTTRKGKGKGKGKKGYARLEQLAVDARKRGKEEEKQRKLKAKAAAVKSKEQGGRKKADKSASTKPITKRVAAKEKAVQPRKRKDADGAVAKSRKRKAREADDDHEQPVKLTKRPKPKPAYKGANGTGAKDPTTTPASPPRETSPPPPPHKSTPASASTTSSGSTAKKVKRKGPPGVRGTFAGGVFKVYGKDDMI
ncbi:hypothetical protein FB45DRAFT_907471 [Roridomyces roridus]|uniref:Uncharacterized protein n=1 Tax=Roridomyces roridus TaxID=1738132 RepID=A0AAD7C1T6_9AGAR|nr:hypothetical protein FB45DRAFT_907471 [Roridomyces roridus]